MELLYLNNAATSFPRPPAVRDAVARALDAPPSDPGRTGRGDDPIGRCRAVIATLLGVREPKSIALLPSATYALNAIFSGEIRPGDHIVTTVLEHNSVLRPVAHLVDAGATVTYLRPNALGIVDADTVLAALRPTTRLVAVTHASNVTGCIQPIEAIASVLAGRPVSLLVDAAQTAGSVPIDHGRLAGRVYLAFSGHKGLYGPPGTGGMVVPDDELRQTLAGGTGSRSESRLHPGELPMRHEAGTPNSPGIAGLLAGVRFVLERSVRQLGSDKSRLVLAIRSGLDELAEVHQTPLSAEDGRAGVTSFWVDSAPSEQIRYMLREAFGVETRAGLHCAPLHHAHLGTAPGGCVRISVGAFNSGADVERLLAAVRGVLRS